MPRRDRSERPSFAGTSARWRESRCEEWNEQTRLAELLTKHLDPAAPIFWTSLENKPLSMVSGMFGKLRGVRSGLPDVMVIHLTGAGREVTFVELKSRRAKASKAQIKLREELLVVGAKWWMARSARAAMIGIHLSDVPFRRKWKPPRACAVGGSVCGSDTTFAEAPESSGRIAGGEAALSVATKAARERGCTGGRAQRYMLHTASTNRGWLLRRNRSHSRGRP
jgi:hypothetical protein